MTLRALPCLTLPYLILPLSVTFFIRCLPLFIYVIPIIYCFYLTLSHLIIPFFSCYLFLPTIYCFYLLLSYLIIPFFILTFLTYYLLFSPYLHLPNNTFLEVTFSYLLLTSLDLPYLILPLSYLFLPMTVFHLCLNFTLYNFTFLSLAFSQLPLPYCFYLPLLT